MRADSARFPARTGPDGSPVLLEDQDRRRWDVSAIRRGLAALARASARGLGPYGLQAAIAAAHVSAPSVEATDWDRIVLLYEALGRVAPSPVVELNRAVAVAMASGPARALAIVDELIASDRLPVRIWSRPYAVNCWPGSDGDRKRAPSWSWRPGSAPTGANARCCCARRLRWADLSGAAAGGGEPGSGGPLTPPAVRLPLKPRVHDAHR
nr:hypothetical protein GCM10020093_023760 [Planobispora longispora]